MFENGHNLSQETNSVEEFTGYCCHAKITVIEKDWGEDFALFFFNVVYVVCLTALMDN